MANASLFIAGAGQPERAIDGLLEIDEPCGHCIVSSSPAIATLADPRGWKDRARRRLVERLSRAHGEIRRVIPPSMLAGLRPGSSDWIEIDLGGRGDRLPRTTLARPLFEADMLFAFANLDRPPQRGERTTIALGLWSQFARSWERFGARLSDDRDGLAAEIALAVVARRYFVAATAGQMAIAVSSGDPIAAELAGRALIRLKRGVPSEESVAPWEEPIVQRASELKLGVQTPDEIALQSLWCGSAADANRFATLVREFADLISIPAPAPMSSRT